MDCAFPLNERVIESYENRPSVSTTIKNKFFWELIFFDFQGIKATEVKKLLKEIDFQKQPP